MIEFRESLQKKTAVFYLGNICGQFERQLEGKVIYNCFCEINYTVESLEQILSKMKELAGNTSNLQGENNERTITKNSGGI